MAVNQFIRRLAHEKNYAKNTIKAYQSDLQEFEVSIQKDILDVDKNDVLDYICNLSKSQEISVVSIRRKISCLRSFYKDLLRMEIRKDNPMEKVVLPKIQRKLPNLVSETELDELFSLFDNTTEQFPSLRDLMIFELLYSCGLRVTELCELTLGSIYLEEKTLRILGKGGKERLIPMGMRLKTLLEHYLPIRKEYLKGVACPYVITSKFRKKVSRMFIWKVLKQYSQELNITELHPHMLRHAFATHMLAHGADLRLIQELLGHSDLATTEIYTHVAHEKLYDTLIQYHPMAQEHSL
ncbi:MAG: site-specific tyrosine recombinase/integron integrase [Brevinema sp.]